MKLIIAGSRNLDFERVYDIIVEKCLEIKPDCIISGNSGNVDKAANLYAFNINHELLKFNADWEKYGRAAGPIRNKEMAKQADALLIIWDGKSRGSANMKLEMQKLNKPVYEVLVMPADEVFYAQ